jgi:hypothetical protein
MHTLQYSIYILKHSSTLCASAVCTSGCLHAANSSSLMRKPSRLANRIDLSTRKGSSSSVVIAGSGVLIRPLFKSRNPLPVKSSTVPVLML